MSQAEREAAVENAPDGQEAVSPEGVDLTLVRWMLSLSPAERLAWCQAQADAIRRLQSLQSPPHDV